MPNYFYLDANGQKQGPINDAQLQAMAVKGIITPNTPLETDTGHQGTAGQVPGLKFPSTNSGNDNSTQVPNNGLTYVTQFRFRSDTENTPILPLLRDFSFRELRPETLFLWIVKTIYAIALFVAIFTIIIMCLASIGMLLYAMTQTDRARDDAFLAASATFGYFILLCIIFPVAAILLRFLCEWSIITFHYSILSLIGISKLPQAACTFLEEWSK